MPAFAPIPRSFQRGKPVGTAQELQNWADTTRALSGFWSPGMRAGVAGAVTAKQRRQGFRRWAASGASQFLTTSAMITSPVDASFTFGAQLLDDTVQPVGDNITVYVTSYGPTIGSVGEQPLNDCRPRYDQGDIIQIMQDVRVVGSTQAGYAYVDGWWMLWPVRLKGCEVAAP